MDNHRYVDDPHLAPIIDEARRRGYSDAEIDAMLESEERDAQDRFRRDLAHKLRERLTPRQLRRLVVVCNRPCNWRSRPTVAPSLPRSHSRPRERRERRHVARSTSSADGGEDGESDPHHLARPGRALQRAWGRS